MIDVPQRLEHLRRDRRGLPVPWLNRWGPEDRDRYRIAPDRNAVGRPAVFLDDDPDGEPDFTKMHFARQRQAMVEGLCSVCGRPVPWSRRCLVVADLSTRVVDVEGLGQAVVVIEPWLDERCAELATGMCPALIRRRRDEQLTVLPVTSARDVEFIASYGTLEIDGKIGELARALMPTMWVKACIAVTKLNITIPTPTRTP